MALLQIKITTIVREVDKYITQKLLANWNVFNNVYALYIFNIKFLFITKLCEFVSQIHRLQVLHVCMKFQTLTACVHNCTSSVQTIFVYNTNLL